MKLVKYYTINLVGIVLLSISCQFQQPNATAYPADTLLDKTIGFPDALLSLKGDQFYSLGSALTAMEGKHKVLSIIDGTCMACIINQLNRMDSVMHDLMGNGFQAEMVFVLNVDPRDSLYFMRNLQPTISAQGTILWDNNYHFERTNSLLTPDEWLRTFMVDEQNRIILYGNPLMRPSLLEEYAARLNPTQ